MARMNNAFQDILWLDGLVKANGYLHAKPLLDRPGYYACVMPLMFTAAIIIGRIGEDGEYDDRWCYHSVEDARRALEAWDGEGEPQGWHRHPPTGRRRNLETGEEWVRP